MQQVDSSAPGIMDELLSREDVQELHWTVRRLEASEGDCEEIASLADDELPEPKELSSAIADFARCYCGERHGRVPDPPCDPGADALTAYLASRSSLLLSDAERHQGDWEAAEEALKRGEQEASNATIGEHDRRRVLPELEAHVAVCRADLLTAQSKWEEAEVEANRALSLFHSRKDDMGKCEALAVRGQVRFDRGDFHEAGLDLVSAQLLAPTPRDEARTQITLAHLYYHMGNDSHAEVFLKSAHDVYEELHDGRGLAQVARHRGKIEFRRARDLRERSLESRRAASEQLAQEGDAFEAQGLRRKAVEHSRRSEEALESAKKLFGQALQRANEAEDHPGVARAHYALAKAYLMGHDLGMAAGSCEDARRAFEDLKDTRRAAMCRTLTGVIVAEREHDHEGQREAESLFEEGLRGLRDAGDRRHLANALYDICEARLRWEDYGGAADALQEAIDVAYDMHAHALVKRFKKRRASFQIDSDRWINLVAEANQSRRQLAESRQAMYTCLQYVRHDMFRELEPIAAGLPALLSEWDNLGEENRKEQVERASVASQYLCNLLDATLTDAKIESGERGVRRDTVPLRPLVENALALMQARLDVGAMAQRCSLHNQVGEDIAVLGEAELLQRVLVNILGNASKFTMRYLGDNPDADPGKITVAAEKADGEVVIRVTDTGTGIRSNDIDRVFDMYGQGSALSGRSETEKRVRGFGIGLAFCMATIRAHHGSIEIDRDRTHHMDEDPDRHGTCVNITLKAADRAPLDREA